MVTYAYKMPAWAQVLTLAASINVGILKRGAAHAAQSPAPFRKMLTVCLQMIV